MVTKCPQNSNICSSYILYGTITRAPNVILTGVPRPVIYNQSNNGRVFQIVYERFDLERTIRIQERNTRTYTHTSLKAVGGLWSTQDLVVFIRMTILYCRARGDVDKVVVSDCFTCVRGNILLWGCYITYYGILCT